MIVCLLYEVEGAELSKLRARVSTQVNKVGGRKWTVGLINRRGEDIPVVCLHLNMTVLRVEDKKKSPGQAHHSPSSPLHQRSTRSAQLSLPAQNKTN